MLKFMRRNASGPWVKGIFLAIVSVFIFWGVGVGVGGGLRAGKPVARVNKAPISETEFQRTYNNLLRMYQEAYKENFKPEMLQGLDLKGKAIDQLVRIRLMHQEADRLGLQATDSELRDSIADMPAFQQNGRFDKDLYVRVLRANNLTPAEFEASKGDEILIGKLQDLVVAGVHITEDDARARFRLENEQFNLKFVQLTPTQFLNQVTVSDDELKQYYDAHQETFREPDKLRIEYVLYTDEAFLPKVEVTDSDIQAYYDTHKDEFMRPEQVHARHILLSVPEDADPTTKDEIDKKAEEILAQLKGGADFATLAKERSQDPGSAAQGGDLGFFPRGKMVPQFDAVAFSLPAGSLSEKPVETRFGFHIIKVEAREEARQQDLGEVRDVILAKLKLEKARELARARAHTDQTKVAGGESLAVVAEAAGSKVQTPIPFAEDESVEGLGRSPLSRAAFTVQPDNVGPVVDLPNGYVIFRVTEKIPAHVPELAQVRDKAESALKKEKAEALAKVKAEAFLAEAQKLGFDDAAKAMGLKVDETGAFFRLGNFVQKLGIAADLKKATFELTLEKPLAPRVYKVQTGDFVVAALKEHTAADDARFNEQKDTLISQAENLRKNQVLEEFLNYLKARATVELNETYLAGIDGGGRPLAPSRL